MGMTALKVLFIGGTGIISSACAQLAVDRGIELYVLNRGETTRRPLPESVNVLHGDIREANSAEDALGDHTFDAVADWIALVPEHIQPAIEPFPGRAGPH